MLPQQRLWALTDLGAVGYLTGLQRMAQLEAMVAQQQRTINVLVGHVNQLQLRQAPRPVMPRVILPSTTKTASHVR